MPRWDEPLGQVPASEVARAGCTAFGVHLRRRVIRMPWIWATMEWVVHFSTQPTAGLLRIGRFQSKLPDFLQAYLSFTPKTRHSPFEPKEKGEHFGTPISSLFRPLFWLPEADIHPSNLPMVVYHVSGSDTSVGTLHAILNKTKHQQFGWGESRTFSLPVQLVPSLKGAHGTCLTLVHFHSAH